MSERLRARIAALREKYVRTFPGEAEQLRRELGEYLAGGAMAPIRDRAHRLAGTSGSYSLDSVFQHAHQLEQCCEDNAGVEDATRALLACLEESCAESLP